MNVGSMPVNWTSGPRTQAWSELWGHILTEVVPHEIEDGESSVQKHLSEDCLEVAIDVEARIPQLDQIGDWRSLEKLQYAAYYTGINGM